MVYSQLVFSDTDIAYVRALVHGVLNNGLQEDKSTVTLGSCEVAIPTSDIGMWLMSLSLQHLVLVLYNNNAIFMIGGGWADYRPTHPQS